MMSDTAKTIETLEKLKYNQAESLAVMSQYGMAKTEPEEFNEYEAEYYAICKAIEAMQGWEAVEKKMAGPWYIEFHKNNDGYHVAGQPGHYPTPQAAVIAAASTTEREGK